VYLQFQPEHFDRRQVNIQLRTLSSTKESSHEVHHSDSDHDRRWPDRDAGNRRLERENLTPSTLGLTLAEGKAILKALQAVVVERQMTAYLKAQRSCAHCSKPCRHKGYHTLRVRTVFGTITVKSLPLHQCPCQPHPTKICSLLAAQLPEHTTPELLFLETKWAALVSYGVTAQLLQDVLPLDEPLHAFTIRQHVYTIAERLEQALGEEQWSFIESSPAEWSRLPMPDGPLTVGIDGSYVRAHRKAGWFEVIAGKSLLAFKRDEESQALVSSKCSAFVQTYDQKPKRRLFELLHSQGHQMNQQITFLSDGGETVRDLQLYLNPQAEHLLDWFHVAMRLTVLQQTTKGLPETTSNGEETYTVRDDVVRELERLKWFLWHRNVYWALQVVQSVEMNLDAAVADSGHDTARKLLKAVEEFHTYIENNKAFIPDYGERYRHGERISTGFVESTVNQVLSKRFCKRQQMQWTQRGTHLLLQIRTRVLNGDWEAMFRECYPGFRPLATESVAA
jgi:hypothetical protein